MIHNQKKIIFKKKSLKPTMSPVKLMYAPDSEKM